MQPRLQVIPFVIDASGASEQVSTFSSVSTSNEKNQLKMTAKRYTLDDSGENVHGLTLLFAHCIGAHKEQWEPIIERIFLTQSDKDQPHHRIREAWAFDWQNHGDAGVLNRELLEDRPEGVSIYEWASAITAFVRSPRMKGHRIVPLGHSAGAGAVMLTTKSFALSSLPYVSLILIEPTMVTQELFFKHFDDRMDQMNFTVEATLMRRDTWPSREEAFRYLSKRFPWSMWEPRVVKLLVTYGLQDIPGSDRVTLKCDKKQEAVSYPDVDGHFEAPLELGRVSRVLPVHIVWGTNNDLVPEFIQDSLCDTTQGKHVASVSRVEDAGHMVVQEKPDDLAMIICEILNRISPGRCTVQSRL
ncbi:alpha/beta-hydrolase [Dendrothele bispora CBS 962.96]|uniref:Alpha/beta-hydrolase n=1 Tax=Dendrothele bispora (strain CBS 962.96) TaxID=1314807 RepID=A0A4S8LJ25_DENBC|nr:alpha/beta-hydrolase [Dendrothele bispora CBS 962.96]